MQSHTDIYEEQVGKIQLIAQKCLKTVNLYQGKKKVHDQQGDQQCKEVREYISISATQPLREIHAVGMTPFQSGHNIRFMGSPHSSTTISFPGLAEIDCNLLQSNSSSLAFILMADDKHAYSVVLLTEKNPLKVKSFYSFCEKQQEKA